MGLIRRAVCLVCSSPAATIMIKSGQLNNNEQALKNLLEIADIAGPAVTKLVTARDRKEVLETFGVCNPCTVVIEKVADLKRQLTEAKADLTGKLTTGLEGQSGRVEGPKVTDAKVLAKQKKLQTKFLECLSSNEGSKRVSTSKGSRGAETDDISETQEDTSSPDFSEESCDSSSTPAESPKKDDTEPGKVQNKHVKGQTNSTTSNTAPCNRRRPGRPKADASKSRIATAAGASRLSKRVSIRRKKSAYQQSRFDDFVVNPSRNLKGAIDKPLKVKKKPGRKPTKSLKPLKTSNKQGVATVGRTTAATTLSRVVDFRTSPPRSGFLRKRTAAAGRHGKSAKPVKPTVLPVPVPANDDDMDDESYTPDDDDMDDDDEELYSESGSHVILKNIKPTTSTSEKDYVSMLKKSGVVVEDADGPYSPSANVIDWVVGHDSPAGSSSKNDLFVVEYPCSHCTVVCSSAEMLRFHYEREHTKTLSFCYF